MGYYPAYMHPDLTAPVMLSAADGGELLLSDTGVQYNGTFRTIHTDATGTLLAYPPVSTCYRFWQVPSYDDIDGAWGAYYDGAAAWKNGAALTACRYESKTGSYVYVPIRE